MDEGDRDRVSERDKLNKATENASSVGCRIKYVPVHWMASLVGSELRVRLWQRLTLHSTAGAVQWLHYALVTNAPSRNILA